MFLVFSFAFRFNTLNSASGVLLFLVGLCLLSFAWSRDILRESSSLGAHGSSTQVGFQWGVALFISSEVALFFSLFWCYFHLSLAPSSQTGFMWPPCGLVPCTAFDLPLLNTIILLSSGLTVTACHHYICAGSHFNSLLNLWLTLALGLYFTFLQSVEYGQTFFSMLDSSYGSVFYMSTGAHGLHVLAGSGVLALSLYRLYLGQFSVNRHLGFEFAAWYWHFVDVVWLVLFSLFYWWGGH